MPHPQMFDDDDPFLARVKELALAYPDAAMKVSHGRPAFFTTKIFAYFGGSQRIDGEWIQHDHCVMVLPDEVEHPILLEDDRVFVPAYLGPSGWLGFELPPLDAPADAWEEIDDLLDASYRRTAGRRRVDRLDAKVARLVPEEHQARARKAGTLNGRIRIADGFDELPPEFDSLVG